LHAPWLEPVQLKTIDVFSICQGKVENK